MAVIPLNFDQEMMFNQYLQTLKFQIHISNFGVSVICGFIYRLAL